MRINEKHLASFASGDFPADKEGFLLKRGEVNKSYQKRWFILKGNMLYYYEKKGERDPIGVIILEGCTVELTEHTDNYSFELVFQGSGSRTYVLAAESQEEMESWMKAMTCAGYDYMKLMVSDLQRQLDEINMQRSEEMTSSQPSISRGRSSRATTKATKSQAATSTLIDFGDFESGSSHQSPARSNPFNTQFSDEAKDIFGATPFNPLTEANGKQPRSFEEMHNDFGEYIQLKMRQAQSKQVLSDNVATLSPSEA